MIYVYNRPPVCPFSDMEPSVYRAIFKNRYSPKMRIYTICKGQTESHSYCPNQFLCSSDIDSHFYCRCYHI